MPIPKNVDVKQLEGFKIKSGLKDVVSYLECRYNEYRSLNGNPWSVDESFVEGLEAELLKICMKPGEAELLSRKFAAQEACAALCADR